MAAAMWPDCDVDVLEDGRYVVECSPEYKLWVKGHVGGGVQAKAKWDARTDDWNVSAKTGSGGLRKVRRVRASVLCVCVWGGGRARRRAP